MDKSVLVHYFLEKGFLVSPDFFDSLPSEFEESSFSRSLSSFSVSPLVLHSSLFREDSSLDVNWSEFEKSRVIFEKQGSSSVYSAFLDLFSGAPSVPDTSSLYEESFSEESPPYEPISPSGSVVVLKSYIDTFQKKKVQDFVDHFRVRYESLRDILLSRLDLQHSISINRLSHKQHGDDVSFIGLISSKVMTKNGNYRLTLEDLTGTIDVLITKTKEELYSLVDDCVLDEVVGIRGVLGQNIVFCNQLYVPDIPEGSEFKKAPDETYAAIISDIHVGLHLFLEEDFNNFLKWTRGEFGNKKQRHIASKLKYLFLNGDLVEGVGIYPGQEEDLVIKDITKQYDQLAFFFSQIPSHIELIICGGNHDALRLSEPQPPLDKKYASALYSLPNALHVSNPSLITIHADKDFPGFDVLMYHGFSIPYYADSVPSIRQAGGMNRTDLIMKYLLQRRHLAPAHGSNLYVPDPHKDPLVIDKVPDIFITGHVHQACASHYKHVTLINSSCWASQSEDNKRRGIVPTPSRVPLLNLKTREVRFMNFYQGS